MRRGQPLGGSSPSASVVVQRFTALAHFGEPGPFFVWYTALTHADRCWSENIASVPISARRWCVAGVPGPDSFDPEPRQLGRGLHPDRRRGAAPWSQRPEAAVVQRADLPGRGCGASEVGEFPDQMATACTPTRRDGCANLLDICAPSAHICGCELYRAARPDRITSRVFFGFLRPSARPRWRPVPDLEHRCSDGPASDPITNAE